MTPEHELAAARTSFAKQIMPSALPRNERLEKAFATVRREAFLGEGPWSLMRMFGYEETPNADPVHLYCDAAVALIPERRVNNGQPSLHAILLSLADPRPGARILHVGAGAGYYSAIMAELAGSTGRVWAIEYDEGSAARARENLNTWPHVETVHGDGAKLAPVNVDLIYVNAGATGPSAAWLDALAEGGRLVLPLTSGWTGAVFLIERCGDDYPVFGIVPCAFIPGEGLRDPVEEELLAEAFKNGRSSQVKRLLRHDRAPQSECWVRTRAWSLAYC